MHSRVCFSFFTKIVFKLTIDICKGKIILEVEYFIKGIISDQMLKFFKTIAFFIPSDPKTFIKKIQVN